MPAGIPAFEASCRAFNAMKEGDGWVDLDDATNLSVHSGLVLGLVNTLKTLADDNSDCLGPRRTRVLAEWPTMVEHLGMLRALGLHLIGNRAARADPHLCAVFNEHLHEARSTLASTADSFDGPRLLDDSEQFGDISAGWTAWSQEDFDLQVNDRLLVQLNDLAGDLRGVVRSDVRSALDSVDTAATKIACAQ